MALNASVPYLRDDKIEGWFTTEKHPVVDTWFFMASPIPVCSVIAVYLLVVIKIGPKFMEKRKPYDLKNVVVVYNALQVIFSFCMCFTITGFRFDYVYELVTNGCYPAKTSDFLINLHIGGWWYMAAKYTEFFDTLFFILRKKKNQITKLHIYHHASTALFSWAYLKYLPGEQGALTAFLNSFVHIFMYTYYMLSAMGPEYQKYLWWKKYITVLQLLQFALDITYYLALLTLNCHAPKGLSLLFIMNGGLFFILFSNFYSYAYKQPKKEINEKQM